MWFFNSKNAPLLVGFCFPLESGYVLFLECASEFPIEKVEQLAWRYGSVVKDTSVLAQDPSLVPSSHVR